MRISIVIASLNEGDLLWRTVQSCLETTESLECEVVVADDASTDASIEELRRRFPGVSVVSHAERRGVSPTKDLAARHSSGDVLVFLDGHCKPEPTAIARLATTVEVTEGLAVIMPSVPVLEPSRWENDFNRVGHGLQVDLQRLDASWAGLDRLNRSERWPWLHEAPSCAGPGMVVSRRLYEALLGFDPDMPYYGLEDVDFGLKAWLLGYSVLHDPSAIIGHRFRASFDNYPLPMEPIICNQLRVARKHYTEPVWNEWLEQNRTRYPEWLWERGWDLFEQRRKTVECERDFLMTHRVHDEFWYAARFGLDWPASPRASLGALSSGRGPALADVG